jgi:hypothetical protein
MAPLQVRKGIRNDAPKPMLQRPPLLNLGCQERFQSGGEIDGPRLIILGCPWFEAECPGIAIDLPSFELQHLTLHSPPRRAVAFSTSCAGTIVRSSPLRSGMMPQQRRVDALATLFLRGGTRGVPF